MSDYTRVHNFTAKDALPTGNANKKILGSQVDADFDAAATAIATKLDKSGGAITGNTTIAGTLGTTSTITIDSASDAVLMLDKAASGDEAYIGVMTGGSDRWVMVLSNTTAESSTATGSDLNIKAYNNSGVLVGTALTITRSNLRSTFGGQVVVAPTATVADPLHGLQSTARGKDDTAYYGVVGLADADHAANGGGCYGLAADAATYGAIGYTAASTSYSVFGNGNGYLGGTLTEASDRKLKTDLQRIEGALDKVSALTGYTFNRIDLPGRHTGLIAQDVQAVLPEAVTDNNGALGLAYGNLAGLLVEAIKELRAEVNAIKLMLSEA